MRLDRAGGRAAHRGGARGRGDEAARDLHERRLARPVGAQESDELALADLEVDPGESTDGAIGLLEAGDGERGRHGRTIVPDGHDEPRKMRVARTLTEDETVVEEAPDPVAGPGEVVCRILACATCGSDVQSFYVRQQAPGGARPRAGGRGRGGRRGRRRRRGRRPRGDPPPRAVRRVPPLPPRPRDAVRALPLHPDRPRRVRRVRAGAGRARRRAAPARRHGPGPRHVHRAARLRAARPASRRRPARRRGARGRRGLQRPAPHRRRARHRSRGGVGARAAARPARARRALGRDRPRQRAGRRRDRLHPALGGDRRAPRRRSRPAARCASTPRRRPTARWRSTATPSSCASST